MRYYCISSTWSWNEKVEHLRILGMRPYSELNFAFLISGYSRLIYGSSSDVFSFVCSYNSFPSQDDDEEVVLQIHASPLLTALSSTILVEERWPSLRKSVGGGYKVSSGALMEDDLELFG